MQCLRPRLARQFAKKRLKSKPYDCIYNRQDDYVEDYTEDGESEEINSIGMSLKIRHALCSRNFQNVKLRLEYVEI